MHALLGVVFFICLVYVSLRILAAVVTAAFPRGVSSRRPARSRTWKALRSPAPGAVRAAGRSAAAAAAHPTNSQVRTQARADARRAWTEVKALDWLEGQRHGRANGGTVTYSTRPTVAQRLRLRPFTPAPASASGNGQNGNPSGTNGNGQPNGTSGTAPPPVNGPQSPAPPPKASPQPAAPASTNGGNVAAGTSTASAEKLIEGINEIHANAEAGGIPATREALAAAHEAAVRFAAMMQMLARTMTEPGSNYGNEITEPISKGGQQFQAGAITIGEGEASLATLINMTVGDLATSARQAPHHRELSENGAH